MSRSSTPSAETLSLSAANANTPPERSLTYEVGSKWDLASGKFSADASIFRTWMQNERARPDPNNPLQNVLGGNQRVDPGMQVSLTGRLTERWQLLSNYALLDGKVMSSIFFPLSVGGPLANVPRNTFNFWSTRINSPGRKLEAGVGGNFVDKRDASSTVPYDPTTGLLKLGARLLGVQRHGQNIRFTEQNQFATEPEQSGEHVLLRSDSPRSHRARRWIYRTDRHQF